MKTHFEKINNRYRGPFEQDKLINFFNQIFANLVHIDYKTKTIIKNSEDIKLDTETIIKQLDNIDTQLNDILKEVLEA